MGTEIFIIIAYFTGMLVPVATVAVFLRLDANPETSRRLPTADSYYMPGEGEPPLLESEQPPAAELGRDGSLDDEV